MVAAMAHFSIEQYHRYFVTGVVPGATDRGRVLAVVRVSLRRRQAHRDPPVVAA